MSVEPWEIGLREQKDFMKQTTSPISHYGLIAQLVEQSAVNRCVVGSSPTEAATICLYILIGKHLAPKEVKDIGSNPIEGTKCRKADTFRVKSGPRYAGKMRIKRSLRYLCVDLFKKTHTYR